MAWYDKGLHFECKRCRHCCGGEPGFVYLSWEAIDSIASYLKIGRDEFLEKYTRKVDQGTYYAISLVEKENYDCIFLSEEGCSIYPVRPLQCRTYPFWPHVLADRLLWDAEKSRCPGIDEGPLHTKNEIIKESNATLLENTATIVK